MNEIKPVFVFDGQGVYLKKETIKQRVAKRKMNEEKAEHSLRKYVLSSFIKNTLNGLSNHKILSMIQEDLVKLDESRVAQPKFIPNVESKNGDKDDDNEASSSKIPCFLPFDNVKHITGDLFGLNAEQISNFQVLVHFCLLKDE